MRTHLRVSWTATHVDRMHVPVRALLCHVVLHLCFDILYMEGKIKILALSTVSAQSKNGLTWFWGNLSETRISNRGRANAIYVPVNQYSRYLVLLAPGYLGIRILSTRYRYTGPYCNSTIYLSLWLRSHYILFVHQSCHDDEANELRRFCLELLVNLVDNSVDRNANLQLWKKSKRCLEVIMESCHRTDRELLQVLFQGGTK